MCTLFAMSFVASCLIPRISLSMPSHSNHYNYWFLENRNRLRTETLQLSFALNASYNNHSKQGTWQPLQATQPPRVYQCSKLCVSIFVLAYRWLTELSAISEIYAHTYEYLYKCACDFSYLE